MRHLVDLTYYKPNGELLANTSFMTERRNASEVGDELRHLNSTGRLPGVIGSLHGYASISIAGKQKDSQALVVLGGAR